MKVQQYDRWNVTRIGVTYQLAEQQYAVGDYDKCRETITQCLASTSPSPKSTPSPPSSKLKTAASKPPLRIASKNDPHRLPRTRALLPHGRCLPAWQKPKSPPITTSRPGIAKQDAMYMLAVVEMKITPLQLDAAQKILDNKLVYFEQSGRRPRRPRPHRTLKGDYTAACKLYRDAAILTPETKTATLLRRSPLLRQPLRRCLPSSTTSASMTT